MCAGRFLSLLLFTSALAAQQIDTANFSSERPKASLADRAESPDERRQFLKMQEAREPQERQRLADDFVSRHPQSWLLAAAYQVAAAASIELQDYDRVLADGRRSLRLLPENAALLVALAQIEAAQGQWPQATRDAEDALLWLSVFRAPAAVKPAKWTQTRRELEEVARGIVTRAGARSAPPWAAAPEVHTKSAALPYAGSAACERCHHQVYESWRLTGMGAMLRPLTEATLLADFSQQSEFRGLDRAVVRFGGRSGPHFEFAAPGGWKRFRIDYAIGSKWQQAYATRLADGRIFVFPIQFNAIQKRWLNYWAAIDPPASERAQVQRFPELSPATNYQRNCAVCHTSQLRLKRLDDATMQNATFREPGVNCEMCHGPCGRHVSAMQTGRPATAENAVPPFPFARLDHWRGTMICGQCHRQSALRDVGPQGEMNYTPSRPYFSWLLSQPFAEFGTRAFYKDGRFRETTFIGEAFMRSACFRRGTAQCASCHDPHPADPLPNRTSLKFPSHPDQMCLQCHSALLPRIAQHTHHAAGSPASRCAACHMPPIMTGLLFPAASHQIDIPRADLTERFGQQNSPNACLLCHKDRDARWVAARLETW